MAAATSSSPATTILLSSKLKENKNVTITGIKNPSTKSNYDSGGKRFNEFLGQVGLSEYYDETTGEGVLTLKNMDDADLMDINLWGYFAAFLLKTYMEREIDPEKPVTIEAVAQQFSNGKMAAQVLRPSNSNTKTWWRENEAEFAEILKSLSNKVQREICFQGLRTSQGMDVIGPEMMKRIVRYLVFSRESGATSGNERLKNIRQYASHLFAFFAGGRGGEIAWVTIAEVIADIEHGCLKLTWNSLKTYFSKPVCLVASMADDLCPILALFVFLVNGVDGFTDDKNIDPGKLSKFLFPSLTNFKSLSAIVTNLNKQLSGLHGKVDGIGENQTTKGMRQGKFNVSTHICLEQTIFILYNLI